MKKTLLAVLALFFLAACSPTPPDLVSTSGDPNDGWVKIETLDIFEEDSNVDLWTACDGPVEVLMENVKSRFFVRTSSVCGNYTFPVQGTKTRWVDHDVHGEILQIRCVNQDMWYRTPATSQTSSHYSISSKDARCQE